MIIKNTRNGTSIISGISLTLWCQNKILFFSIFYLIDELSSYLRYFSTNSIALWTICTHGLSS